MRTIIVSLYAAALLFNPAWADHEVDHRYNIRGYVLDSKQQGLGNLTVQAFGDGESLGSTKTSADGYYSLHLHLHDPDHGRTLKLRAGQHEAELRVTFEVGNDTTDRIHQANFVGGKFIEGDLGRFRIPGWSYAVGGLVLFILLLAFLERRRKRKIRLAKYGPADSQPAAKRKPKKARRKKH